MICTHPWQIRPGLAEERKAQGLPSRYWETNAHGPSYTKINYSSPDVPSYSIHAQVNLISHPQSLHKSALRAVMWSSGRASRGLDHSNPDFIS